MLLGAMPQLTMALTIGGAVFLACYGIKAFWRMSTPQAMSVTVQSSSNLAQVIGTTAAFTFLNPHVYLDTILLIGAAGSAQPPALRPVFAAGAVSANIIWFAALGYGARILAPFFARPVSWKLLDAVVGAVMLTLSASLIGRIAL